MININDWDGPGLMAGGKNTYKRMLKTSRFIKKLFKDALGPEGINIVKDEEFLGIIRQCGPLIRVEEEYKKQRKEMIEAIRLRAKELKP